MASFLKEFEHLRIQLEDIKSATDNFAESKVIGSGGFGKVYLREVSHSQGKSMGAYKRLDRKHGQGDPEFLKEILMLSGYKHENLISLLGFCDEGGEKILVYEYASNRSLDYHLSSTHLTWTQRIKICLDAARGLSYLHDPKGTMQRVLHRDIKSSNILLDDNWNAKVSDMGLSRTGPANQPHTFLFTNAVGTPGYCDPEYMYASTLSKESDVYSFGVVLFEVLCGRVCYKKNNNNNLTEILVPTWKKAYEQKKLHEIVFQDVTQPMDSTSLETFSGIAFDCLNTSHEKRPPMARVVEELETALEFEFQKPLYKCIKVDLKRANDMEIMLTEVNMQFPDIMAAALSMDESIFDGDQIESLIKFCPTEEEMELLKNYTGDKEMLGKFEQFYLELMKVPRVQSKLRVFLFKIQFNTQLSELKKSLNTVNAACDEVLPHELSALLDSQVELVNLEAATKIQLKPLIEEMQAINKGLEMVEQELDASANDGPVSKVFHKALLDFMESAVPEMRSLITVYSETGRNADALALYFGKDPSRYSFEQVAQTLSDFLRLNRRHPLQKAFKYNRQ